MAILPPPCLIMFIVFSHLQLTTLDWTSCLLCHEGARRNVLLINDILVRARGYGLREGKRCSAIAQETHRHNPPEPIKWIKYIAAQEKQHCRVLNCCSVRHQLSTLLWHLRELGGVKKNDNRFVSVKELSPDTENSSASLLKAQRKVFACLAILEWTTLLGWKSDSSLLSSS